jgi:hypothetical protein
MQEFKTQEVQIPIPVFPQNVPIMYSNGFITNVGASDVSVIMLLDGLPSIKLHMSYTSAKTLKDMLNKAVETLETATKHTIMVSNEVELGLRKMSKESK